MPNGMLIDTTRCTGCRGCQVACKQWNENPAVKTTFSPEVTNPLEQNAFNYNLLECREIEEDGKLNWIFAHKRCLHCYEPACVSVCPVGALHKRPTGAVVWDQDKCFGCRYCQNACPFQIPKFEWDDNWAKITKCTMCWNRVENGVEPACAATCPTGAIKFGERADLLAEAYERLANDPDRYYPYVYGEKEAGGTHVLYLSSVEPEKIGFDMHENEFFPSFTREFLGNIPLEISIVASLMVGIWYFRGRRIQAQAHDAEHAENKAGKH
ncbi:MAG: 4Fe-4S dicluster domain-containing protein [Dehalococcoides mccartyi]|jgi:Fe-S-cluster-containing hydrogenase components 1|uniref:4Fe-4S dicluster domain-containing protein n=3 Tax=root TaxID=1 RepID=A0A0V8M4L2_9CHLR|nr:MULTISPECIES: 4Fe-4S dicluster domain-containing protein [Dehalococcoides]AAW40579.1 [Ni/Fe] hydrogenase, iron-sulfur cluster-binding subunit, putative [Dehalococcoides mccartyi 195]AII58888.1 Ni/Fe hydrogenase [Dehalococcoides mccartyi CG4]AQU02606.1 Ni/Fe hydrogenase [Dehalococcoides mccartyi]AQU03942.1 Ni/Fe hydrogenase [Dehalococcoides mccartyi]KSV18465.1 Ni/Fe hydrogenase [Dehalococcoides mccartyi]